MTCSSDSARTEVDAFKKLLNQSFEATPRAPVDKYLGMHEEDTCMSYEEEDTCMSYEEEY
jgi:hypothetical protein